MEPTPQAAHTLAVYLSSGGPSALVTATVLLVMSMATWYWIVLGLWRVYTVRVHQRRVIRALGGQENLVGAVDAGAGGGPFAVLVGAALDAQRQFTRVAARGADGADYTARMLGQVIAREQLRLERGLTVLATVGSTSPFVGLLGTVLGIYRALMAMGSHGNASLATVALPVGEALVMTAAGLAVAIPAVIAYNGLLRANRLTRAALEDLGEDLLRHVVAGTPLGHGAHAPASARAIPQAA